MGSWTLASVTRHLADASDLNLEVPVEGRLLLRRHGIRRIVDIGRDSRDRALWGWSVRADYEELSSSLAGFGGVGVEIWRPAREDDASIRYRYPWPARGASLSGSALEDFSAYAPPALNFVKDVRDLGDLLLSATDVHRGPVWTHLPNGSAPSRLAKAVILARYTSDPDLEERAFQAIRENGERDISWVPGQTLLFRQAVADWAKKYDKKVDVDLADLVRLKTRPLPQ